MGRPRKTQNQKQAAKRANLANMANLEKMLDLKDPSNSSSVAGASINHASSAASPRSCNDPEPVAGPSKKVVPPFASLLRCSSNDPEQTVAISSEPAHHQQDASQRVVFKQKNREKAEHSINASGISLKDLSHARSMTGPSKKRASPSATTRLSQKTKKLGAISSVPVTSQRIVSDTLSHSGSVPQASKKRAYSSASLTNKSEHSGAISSKPHSITTLKDGTSVTGTSTKRASSDTPHSSNDAGQSRAIPSETAGRKRDTSQRVGSKKGNHLKVKHSKDDLPESYSTATTLKNPSYSISEAGPSKKRVFTSVSSEPAGYQRDVSQRVKHNKTSQYSKPASSEPYPTATAVEEPSYLSSVAGPSKKRASSSASDTEQSGIISSISVNQQRDVSQHVTSDLPSCPSVVPELSKLHTSSFDSDESSNDPEQAETLCTVLAQVHSHQSCVPLFESELYPKKRIALSTSGSISNASGEVTDTFARRGAGSVEDLFEGFRERKEYEASGKLIEELRARIDNQTEEIRLLQSEVHKLRALNMSLQEVLVQKGQDYTFAEIPGYPKTEWLLSVSQNAGDSDYLFIKELVFHLFPEGVGSATPTGRPSNNPKGRSNIQPGNSDDGTPPMQKLDPQKVQYMKDRLYDRRRILQEPAGVAVAKSKMVNKHIANVIANNPSLRSKSKKQ